MKRRRKIDNLKYAKCIVTEPKPFPPEIQEKLDAVRAQHKSTIKSTHLLTVDDEIIKDFFYVDCAWLWSGSAVAPTEESHTHEFDEVIGFIGSKREDPYDLGGKITIWLDDKPVVLAKSSLIFVPAGTKHCPVVFDRIDTPVFFVTISPVKKYDRKNLGNEKPTIQKTTATGASKYTIISELKKDFTIAATDGTPPPPPNPNLKSRRILHLEDDIAKGSFYLDFVWIYEGSGQAPAPVHKHEWEELIAMVGCDPEHPRDLGGKMSIALGDETHVIAKSSLVCIPKGLEHCPWKFLDIKKPTLVFTAGPSGMYTGSHKKS
jgi:hypothetical protein